MLRPATPLSILFLAAFALLLLSTLSTPIIKGIPLATFQGVDFGVFGYCKNGDCRGPMIGYDTDGLFNTTTSASDFSLPSATRHSLSSILIVHPVACLMTLICFSLAVAAHFHSPAHSPRYLLALLIFTFPTLLVSLLAFLVDILLFVPHMAWGGWIVLAATIIIVASGVVTCAMRRTLVSRKARKRRIAENTDMNGQSFHATRSAGNPPSEMLPKAESPPPLSGNTMSDDNKSAGYATFEVQKNNAQDDMIPLNNRNPSLKTVSSSRTDAAERQQYMNPPRGPPGPPGRGRQPVDQYGNPIPPMPNDPYMMQNQPRGPPPNRGGPYARGRGGYPPRGGYGPPRGGYGPPRGGMRGPPPPGWNGNGNGRGMRPAPGPGPMGRGAPPPGYSNQEYQAVPPPRNPSPYVQQQGPPPNAHMQGPMSIGQAIEMDSRGMNPPMDTGYGLRDSDGDVQGMLALQQGGFPAQAPQRATPGLLSPTSEYSQADERQYLPPRTGWNQTGNNSSDQTLNHSNSSRGLSPIQDSPVELPAQLSTIGMPKNESSSDYYEDVDPRFAAPQQKPMPPPLNPNMMASNPSLNVTDPNLIPVASYEDLPEGARSPAASEASHFTSVSQRGINPNWRPPQGGPMPYGPYGPRRPMRQEDVILEANAANPDFALPGRGRGRGRGRGGMVRGGGGSPPPATLPNLGLGSNQGRYPGASAI
ncbi:unnamed protein product [Periconia digitata]|uniref:Pali-domain-containing protein n=1 Tax=Periconia digitata TaxID=1303443 RepID=A0A9W4UJF3_9PLEO|nr:unnamed protein product [Periconia digitata]